MGLGNWGAIVTSERDFSGRENHEKEESRKQHVEPSL